ncbi:MULTISPECIES: polyprenyl diphosphate synthase [Marinobacter]|jgi:undecaprenyl diphosphate synthase|uniref:Ditrans,polycis-undecaprenyl-diphosphate synthase ((2E,6E)-farnesyl-diphosphate specific) n=1 Tax=Marinobacter vinifirmus TaxID=355591 RepID=A0A259W292_9GAMM|nr:MULTISPECIES: polyprenyl diphosphate synthase [Marinobacter]HBM48827.1 di-trans,poly-cis-decaprenylcistransferase [Marinobacter sp.]ERP90203.1 UDP pyrophosphate synthase [Marinobacter sp. ES-1]MCE0759617.1 polyprenyl diphosphate synthase [Marinobacter sp. G11]OZC36727.1 di-trans,poly-cis-decaprenylcistransferase [Marinobacter vinifirmus]TVT35745.1 MAG: di-trans,poly-cis-decaprenylcistransferase [Marinobacter vinifirmus]|tara:strand:+ start:2062 stop:2832 length:771 start_codon:yes stop_codon:yes gene_type:complete
MTGQVTAEIPVEADSRPRHVAIIMDGNNRWAKAHRLKGVAGHKAGVDAVKAVVETCARQGVEVLTLFAFSSENWRRPKDEVSALMRLFLIALEREVRKLHRNNIRLRIIGDRSAFNSTLQEHMERAETLTRDNTAMTLVIAANYGGHWDITEATRQVAQKVRAGELEASDITDDLIQQHLSIGDLPMPDLLIRTAGEQRISNFLLWHLAYTEFYFSEVFWPDFKADQMQKALEAYAGRKRRFGQTDDQIAARATKQ